jgi:hypothetical protein
VSDDTLNPHAFNPYNELIDTIQNAINGFAADLCGAGPGPVDTLDQEFAELRRLCAELDEAKVFASSHALGHLSLAGALRELNAVALRAMDRADAAEAETASLRSLLDAMGIQIAIAAANHADLYADPDIMGRVHAFCGPHRAAILEAARRGAGLIQWDIHLTDAVPTDGGEE